jgi:hypothetical protein
MTFRTEHFSHIYVEEEIRNKPMTSQILDHFPRAEIILIRQYHDVFSRSKQDYSVQKHSRNLILARQHGTLLYDVDFAEMERAITPSKEKLDSKGIKSVRQRVTNLKDCGLLFDFEVLKSKLIDYFCKDMQFLSNPDMDEVLKIEQTYLDENFIKYGRRN